MAPPLPALTHPRLGAALVALVAGAFAMQEPPRSADDGDAEIAARRRDAVVLGCRTDRSGSRRCAQGETRGRTGLLVRYVALDGGDGRLLHLELSLPGVDGAVHLVEERRSEELRIVHREVTRGRGRTLRVTVPLEGPADFVTYGEGETLRREVAVPDGATGPLERLESEREGSVEPGPFLVLDPLSGRFEHLVARRFELPLGGVLWTHGDSTGALRSAALFRRGELVAWCPSPGRGIAGAVDPERFEVLRSAAEAADATEAAAPRAHDASSDGDE
ncbi:MAG: hypothetical protein R3F34_11995 [Planctomycetota bacterium]